MHRTMPGLPPRRCAVAAALALLLPAAGRAAEVSVRAFPGEERAVPTALADTLSFASVPELIDVVHAHPDELAAYGFPPRPDPRRAPAAYRSWRQATEGVRRIAPTLQPVPIHHGPMMRSGGALATATNAASTVRIDNAVAATSSNWSGYVVAAPAYNWGMQSFTDVSGDWIVPMAQTAFGVCRHNISDVAVYSSTWVGIDGNGSTDVLQAGTESDATCDHGQIGSFHAAWYEWYPYNEVRVTNLPISAGGAVYVHVWATSDTRGHAYIADKSNHKAVSMVFDAPPRTHLIGNSAEWVVERPTVDGALSTLTNYVQELFAGAQAIDAQGKVYYPGAGPSTGQQAALAINMTNNNQVISAPSLIGQDAIWFMAQGTASRDTSGK